ncbi:MAG: tyrosine-type recombinase/integrase [Agathobaculum sp.]|uniref:tyrosine-type recombinase/integrase n=1 Tax=Agathobaculum sp. TaxID=2048138 RepID=UPI003D8B1229
MKEKHIFQTQVEQFLQFLQQAECSPGTIEKYRRDVNAFACWLDARPADKQAVTAWRTDLLRRGYAAVTVNSMLVAVNRFFDCMGWQDCKVRLLRLQRNLFRGREKELTRQEYMCLVKAAAACGKERLALLMETICATGIRVSEVQYITVEAARQRRAEISLKGKIRVILLPGALCRKLLRFARQQKTVSGEIFLTRNGTGLSRKQIWAEMKAVCKLAGVQTSKVFPHNLRHLFARTFYKVCRDVAKLADVLGHSSMETTRLYLVSTGEEHEQQLNRLRLLC